MPISTNFAGNVPALAEAPVQGTSGSKTRVVGESNTAVGVSGIGAARNIVLDPAGGAGVPGLAQALLGAAFLGSRGYFSTTSGNITDDVILQYLQEHEPTSLSRSCSVPTDRPSRRRTSCQHSKRKLKLMPQIR